MSLSSSSSASNQTADGHCPVHGEGPHFEPLHWTHAELPCTVEVRLRNRTSTPLDTVRRLVYQYISENCTFVSLATAIRGWEVNAILADSVERVWVCEGGMDALRFV